MAKIYTMPVVERARKKAGKPEPVPYQWLCKRCKHDTGVETSEVIQVRIAPRVKGVRLIGGNKMWICRHCNQRGITTQAP